MQFSTLLHRHFLSADKCRTRKLHPTAFALIQAQRDDALRQLERVKADLRESDRARRAAEADRARAVADLDEERRRSGYAGHRRQSDDRDGDGANPRPPYQRRFPESGPGGSSNWGGNAPGWGSSARDGGRRW